VSQLYHYRLSKELTTFGRAPLYKPFPAKPAFIFGRETEENAIASMLLAPEPAWIAILGTGGIGKTALATSVLHDDRVIAKYGYGSRYFVDCQTVGTVDRFWAELADALRIPTDQRDQHLIDLVVRLLSERMTILCVDNFETVWDGAEMKLAEQCLSTLSQINTLSVVVTMRGIERPEGVRWTKPLLDPIQPLAPAPALEIFKEICGKLDKSIEELAKQVDYVPLAVTLLAHLCEYEKPDDLLVRLKKEGTTLITRAGNRLEKDFSIDVSIYLSLTSQRMKDNPDAEKILGLMAVLPDGLSAAGIVLEKLQEFLPGINLRNGLSILTKTALIYRDPLQDRFRLLSPIRQYCELKLALCSGLHTPLIDFYTRMVIDRSDYTDPGNHEIIPSEMTNIREALMLAFSVTPTQSLTFEAAIAYTNWTRFIGHATDEIMTLAINTPATSQATQADCLYCVSNVYIMQDKLQEAEASLTAALAGHQIAHTVLGEAYDRQTLGDLYIRQDKLEEAEKSLTAALAGHQATHDMIGEANVRQILGYLYMKQNRLQEAETFLIAALAGYQAAHSVLGEANDRQRLGNLYMMQGRLEEAETSLITALAGHQAVHSVIGEAHGCQLLGDLYVRQDRLEEAEVSFTAALAGHQAAHDVIGEMDDRQKLGDLYTRQNRLQEAETFLMAALAGYQTAYSVLGEANNRQRLGYLYMMQDRLEEAETSLTAALADHQTTHSVLGEAIDRQILGDLYMRQNRLQEAETFLLAALAGYQAAHSVLGEANGRQRLGDLYMRQNRLEEAETFLTAALTGHQAAHCKLEEANDRQRLGDLYLKQDKLEEAETSLTAALAGHLAAHSVLGEANDKQSLSDLYFRQDRLEEAETSLTAALTGHQVAHNVLGEAIDRQSLSDLYFRQDRLEEAETSLTAALTGHQVAHNVLGEAIDRQMLGDLYLSQNRLEEAETFLTALLAGYQAAHDVLGEADVRQSLSVLYLRQQRLQEEHTIKYDM